MSASMKDWENDVKKMGFSERACLITALNNLNNWKMFREQYGWTNYTVVKTILEIAQREEDDLRTKQYQKNRGIA